MNLDFELLVVSNFKSFIGGPGGPHRFPLNRIPGLHFLRGENELEPSLGANNCGKTTLTEALTWCLFGCTLDGQRNPDIIPWKGATGPTTVIVKFKIDNRLHTLTRSMEPNRLTLDKQDINQDKLEKLIGLSLPVFGHTILLAQGGRLFFDLDPSEKLKVFSETLDLDRWEDRSKKAASETNELEKDLAEAEGEIVGQEGALTNIQSLMTVAKTSAAEWDANRKTILKDAERQIKEWKAEYEKWLEKVENANLDYDSALTEMRPLEKQLGELEQALLDTERQTQEEELRSENYKVQLAQRKKELAELSKAKKCPTCGQSIKQANLANHKAELELEIEALETRAALGVPKALKRGEKQASEALERARKGAAAFLAKANDARDRLDTAQPFASDLDAKIRSLQQSHRSYQEEANPHRDQLQTLRRQEGQTVLKLENLDKEVTALKRKIERTRSWVKGFKDVRLYIIEEILQELEIATNELLPESGLYDWQVKFDIERETKSGTTQRKLNVTILSPQNKKPVKWAVWGGGVGQRLRVIGALALSEVLLGNAGVNCNLEILDEPTAHLSKEGVRDLCEYLSDRAKRLSKTCIYVDHTAVESQHFASTTTVVKTKDGSFIQ